MWKPGEGAATHTAAPKSVPRTGTTRPARSTIELPERLAPTAESLAASMAALDVHQKKADRKTMKMLILFVGWCILFVLCWPVALLALILFPVVWLLSIPLRLIGITLEAVFALFSALLFLPARLLGWRRREVRA